MKAVMISIRPDWVYKILNGIKTIEVRKTAPKIATPFKCYIYCTLGGGHLPYSGYCGYDMTDYSKDFFANGKVVAEFICDNVRCFDVPYPAFQNKMDKSILEQSCLTYYQLHRYAYHDNLYGWHISDLKIYEEPKKLSDFYIFKKCNSCKETCYESSACIYDEDCMVPAVITRAPQSWCYVEEL